MSPDRVQCNICGENFRATPSHINLICKGCFKNKEKEIIEKFLKDLFFNGESYCMSKKNHKKWETCLK